MENILLAPFLILILGNPYIMVSGECQVKGTINGVAHEKTILMQFMTSNSHYVDYLLVTQNTTEVHVNHVLASFFEHCSCALLHFSGIACTWRICGSLFVLCHLSYSLRV
jgi:hypothetical protein